ncbi:helicase-like transcription factor CHR28 isoform X4 [Helianthus annuus]|uniref:helicase-like transcription factor CHR28 isoform X4 n=1 Tax=Helianthus annuus TaxID=4232 RepID=UPI001652EDE9|nr:helicase-like transcription factor CHR28 isoform X4 [Helianthus annuus]
MVMVVPFTINQYGIEYRRLDGSMSSSARDSAVKDFNTDPEVPVVLMSLKAWNLGLNTVSASHVILYDLCLNLTTEDKAIDQAHRIGQTRPVTVSRLIVKNTVEDIILALQDKKRKMVALAFGEDQSGTSTAHLTNEDLRFLFMGAR